MADSAVTGRLNDLTDKLLRIWVIRKEKTCHVRNLNITLHTFWFRIICFLSTYVQVIVSIKRGRQLWITDLAETLENMKIARFLALRVRVISHGNVSRYAII